VEADALYSDDSLPLFEVHPELSFTMMGDGQPKAGKKSWHGQRDWMAHLESAGIVIPAEIGDAGQAGPDDVLDAAAAAWSAHRIATHVACSVPDPPQSNERGQRMAIWY
jgi:predicted RNase H-like nuclease